MILLILLILLIQLIQLIQLIPFVHSGFIYRCYNKGISNERTAFP